VVLAQMRNDPRQANSPSDGWPMRGPGSGGALGWQHIEGPTIARQEGSACPYARFLQQALSSRQAVAQSGNSAADEVWILSF
jgi:hypothetical protein